MFVDYFGTLKKNSILRLKLDFDFFVKTGSDHNHLSLLCCYVLFVLPLVCVL